MSSMPDSQVGSKVRKATVSSKLGATRNLVLIHDFHSGYEAGRSTAGLPVVLPAGVTNWFISSSSPRDPQSLAPSVSTKNSGSDMRYGKRKGR